MSEECKLKDIFSHIKEKTPYMHGLNKPNMPAVPSTQVHYHSSSELLLLRWRSTDFALTNGCFSIPEQPCSENQVKQLLCRHEAS